MRALFAWQQSGDLRHREVHQRRVKRSGFDAVQITFIAGTNQQTIFCVKRERIHQILRTAP